MVTDVCAGLSALRIEDVRVSQIVVVGLGLSELAALNGARDDHQSFSLSAWAIGCHFVRPQGIKGPSVSG